MEDSNQDLLHDLLLPTSLFICLGGMTWAVRGCSGFGALKGCVFAGVTWGIGWWYISRQTPPDHSRRYSSAWIILALTVAIGFSGTRGWMQWPSFWRGELSTNSSRGEFLPISTSYGFLWLFIAGVPWAGLGACALAWTAPREPLKAWEWILRLASGFGVAYLLGVFLFNRYPGFFLPLYDTASDRYQDLQANPNLRRLVNDNTAAIRHLGFYFGFLLFEAVRRDWKNVKLILTVGVLNGVGWAALQNWNWARNLWPESNVNFWRCWESSGGVSIGLAYGVAYFLVNRPEKSGTTEPALSRDRRRTWNLEWLWAATLLLTLSTAALTFTDFPIVAMRQASSQSITPDQAAMFLAAAVACLVVLIARHLVSRTPSGQAPTPSDATLDTFEQWTGYGLMLVLAWFIRHQTGPRRGGDMALTGASGWIAAWIGNWGADFFYIVAVYGIVAFAVTTLHRGSERRLEPSPHLERTFAYLAVLAIAAMVLAEELRSVYLYHVLLPLACAVFGVLYCALPNRSDRGCEGTSPTLALTDVGFEQWGLAAGLAIGIGLSLKNGLRGWANIYLGNEEYWTRLFWNFIGAAVLAFVMVSGWRILRRKSVETGTRDPFPYATTITLAVLIHQNLIAQIITGPVTRWEWREQSFSFYYAVLFVATVAIVRHYHIHGAGGTVQR